MKRVMMWAMAGLLVTGLSLGMMSCDKKEDPKPKTENKDSKDGKGGENPSTGGEDSTNEDLATSLPTRVIEGVLTQDVDLKWSKDTVYKLKGIVVVGEGKELEIEAGTTIVEEAHTGATGVLVVPRGAKIKAEGTKDAPIVFTSSKTLTGGSPQTGDFGGIVLLGKATTNKGTDIEMEGLGTGTEKKYTLYGGNEDSDNSGIMKYVRIEYAGYELARDNEINGLTCGGVGSGTTLEYIQVSWGQDDAFEFFGGTVNASFLVAYATDDDSFDFDLGYRGTIQHAISVADSRSTHSESSSSPGKSDSNGIELDGNKDDDDATPKTHPTLENVTIIGLKENVKISSGNDAYKYGVRIRRGGEITMKNCIVTGYPSGIVCDGDAGDNLDKMTFENVLVHGYTIAFKGSNKAGSSLSTPAGITEKTGAQADDFNMQQPFINVGELDWSGASAGAFAATADWHKDWTKF